MTETDSSPDHYLTDIARKRNALARLVASPERERGMVHTPREIAQQPYLWRHTARLMQEHARDLQAMEAFTDMVETVVEVGEGFIDRSADAIFELAQPEIRRAFYLGNNDLLGAATESALKVQELACGEVMAKGEDTLAFRHGPISAVNAESLVCFYLSENDHTRRYEMDVLLQYQAAFRELGTRTVLVGARRPGAELGDGVTFLTYDPEEQHRVPALHQVNVAALFGQLFGMFFSYRRGFNVDDPSVAKALYSRTVQGVRIYEPAADGVTP